MPKIYFEILNKDICSVAKNPTPAYMGAAEWWKNMPKYNYEVDNVSSYKFPTKGSATMRNCPAVNDSINFGYILYTPTDIYVDSTDENQISWSLPPMKNYSILDSDSQDYIGFHDPQQLPGLKNDNNFHKYILKINTFFGIKTDSGYSVWITHPIGRNDLPFKVIDGIIDTDKYTSIFPYSLFIKKNFKGVIKSGTPLIQVVPFKRENFISEITEKNLDEIKLNISKLSSFFTNGYKKIFWNRKKFF